MLARRLIHYPSMGWANPFAEMERISRNMDFLSRHMLGSPSLSMLPSKVFPAVNISEDKDKYFVCAELPGIKADEIDIQVHGKNLTISGERKIPSEGDNVKYHRREREAGKFSRVIGLPGEIDADGVDARVENGVLLVKIAKSEAAKPKQITVH
jgi:HSP20 family protein